VTHEKKKKNKKRKKNKNKRQELVCLLLGNLVVVGHTTFKVIVVKKQNCKKIVLKINMHGSLLASCLLKT
jgi:hypothetical protein